MMAISKLILNGNVQMDVTGTTAIESDVRTGKKFTKVNGVEVTGTDPGASLQSSKTVTPSTSQQTILPDSGYDGLEQVVVNAMPTGSAGTPTATKGTVSNHSISVTPSVTNTTGYITGGTKTGTAVTVTASELASGNKAIADNGTGIDVVGYSTVSVAVPKKYTATLGSTSYGSYSRCYIMYGTTRYYQPNQTFEFTAGDTITCVLTGEEQQYSQSQKIIVNGVVVAQDVYSTSYTYTLQTKDVKIDLVYGDNGSITISEAVIPTAYQGTRTITPTTSNHIISDGTYLSGTITIVGDEDLVSSNILNTANIFGVQGSATAAYSSATGVYF